MKKTFPTITSLFKSISKHWLKVMFLSSFAYLLLQKDLSFHVNMNASDQHFRIFDNASNIGDMLHNLVGTPSNTTLLNYTKAIQEEPQSVFPKEKAVIDQNLANTYSNMNFLEVEQKDTKHQSKKRKQQAYVQRFAKLAQAEMRKYNIPASIILAQGLIETNAGESRLSTRNNNHFGIKCFSKKCKKGHCSNFTDDSHKDFFRIYNNAWESYRGHSLMLQGKRYHHLTKLAITDYKNWAKGLKKAGYATDPKYAFKLIRLIKSLKLYKYDQ